MANDNEIINQKIRGINLNRVESTSSEWIKQALEKVNKEKSSRQPYPLLQIISQYWANQFASKQMEISHISVVKKSEEETCDGIQNFQPNPSSCTGKNKEGVWHSELKDYGLHADDFKQNVSQEVGVAYASNPEDGKTYVVSTYLKLKSTASNDEIKTNMLNNPGKMNLKLELPMPPRRKKTTDSNSSSHHNSPEAPPRLKRLSSVLHDECTKIQDDEPKFNFMKNEICNDAHDLKPLESVESKTRAHRPEVPPKPKKPVIPPRQRKQTPPPLKNVEFEMQ